MVRRAAWRTTTCAFLRSSGAFMGSVCSLLLLRSFQEEQALVSGKRVSARAVAYGIRRISATWAARRRWHVAGGCRIARSISAISANDALLNNVYLPRAQERGRTARLVSPRTRHLRLSPGGLPSRCMAAAWFALYAMCTGGNMTEARGGAVEEGAEEHVSSCGDGEERRRRVGCLYEKRFLCYVNYLLRFARTPWIRFVRGGRYLAVALNTIKEDSLLSSILYSLCCLGKSRGGGHGRRTWRAGAPLSGGCKRLRCCKVRHERMGIAHGMGRRAAAVDVAHYLSPPYHSPPSGCPLNIENFGSSKPAPRRAGSFRDGALRRGMFILPYACRP